MITIIDMVCYSGLKWLGHIQISLLYRVDYRANSTSCTLATFVCSTAMYERQKIQHLVLQNNLQRTNDVTNQKLGNRGEINPQRVSFF